MEQGSTNPVEEINSYSVEDTNIFELIDDQYPVIDNKINLDYDKIKTDIDNNLEKKKILIENFEWINNIHTTLTNKETILVNYILDIYHKKKIYNYGQIVENPLLLLENKFKLSFKKIDNIAINSHWWVNDDPKRLDNIIPVILEDYIKLEGHIYIKLSRFLTIIDKYNKDIKPT